jgi:hypothetical protein
MASCLQSGIDFLVENQCCGNQSVLRCGPIATSNHSVVMTVQMD